MTPSSLGIISVIGMNFVEPILELVQKLEASTPVLPNEVQTGMVENGYSCSIAVLTILILESAANRVR